MPGYERQLFGMSKLNLMPDPAEREEAKAYDTDTNDLQFLLDKLCETSATHGVDWTVQIEGDEVGSIIGGSCDPTVQATIEVMASLGAGTLEGLEDLV